MAKELTTNGGLSFVKGTTEVRFGRSGVLVDVAGQNYIQNIQSIGTTQEAILLGDVASPGYAIFENLDPTNYVTIRPASGAADMIRLNPGEVAGPFRLAASAPFAIANTAAIRLRYLIIEA